MSREKILESCVLLNEGLFNNDKENQKIIDRIVEKLVKITEKRENDFIDMFIHLSYGVGGRLLVNKAHIRIAMYGVKKGFELGKAPTFSQDKFLEKLYEEEFSTKHNFYTELEQAIKKSKAGRHYYYKKY
jgi:hypothetical protein